MIESEVFFCRGQLLLAFLLSSHLFRRLVVFVVPNCASASPVVFLLQTGPTFSGLDWLEKPPIYHVSA